MRTTLARLIFGAGFVWRFGVRALLCLVVVCGLVLLGQLFCILLHHTTNHGLDRIQFFC